MRDVTVLGFVGAGGIGQDLMEAIRKFCYSDVSAILVMIVAVVTAIDISTPYGVIVESVPNRTLRELRW